MIRGGKKFRKSVVGRLQNQAQKIAETLRNWRAGTQPSNPIGTS
jgi:hypothetical protein